MRKLRTVIYITVGIFIFLTLISFLFTFTFNRNLIGIGGLIIGFILTLPSLKIHRILFFGSRANHAEVIIPDEHLEHQVYKQYEKEEDDNLDKKSKHIIDSLGYSGILLITISLFLVPM